MKPPAHTLIDWKHGTRDACEIVVTKIAGDYTRAIGPDDGFGDVTIGHFEANARLECDYLSLERFDTHFAKQ